MFAGVTFVVFVLITTLHSTVDAFLGSGMLGNVFGGYRDYGRYGNWDSGYSGFYPGGGGFGMGGGYPGYGNGI
ncbi:unnamed protein product [Anisakis simplex]|uniref:Glycine rich protein n=1 Tax=Anisakis simplex TaxID=6269 RepID=A0A0M3J457_ANISI|nr:unnamed protein product [Anisakis simplex]